MQHSLIHSNESQHSVYAGDMTEVLQNEIEPDSIDFIFTSPPYNFGFNYGPEYDDSKPWNSYYQQFYNWLPAMYRALAPGGRLCLMHYFSAGTAKERVTPLMTLNEMASRVGFGHHAVIMWYDRTISRRTAWGSWMMPSAPYINSPMEGILVLYKSYWKRPKPREDAVATISRDEFMRGALGVWDDIPAEKDRNQNPAPFPVALPRRAIELLTWSGDTVLDPFAGSGATAVAALETARNSISVDISSEQAAYTVDRLLSRGGENAELIGEEGK